MTNPKHTTDEYLAWIDSNVEAARKLLSPLGGTDDVTTYVLVSSTASLLANRDVLVRHQSTLDGVCMGCSDFTRFSKGLGAPHKVMFPCPTYLDIAQRLDEVM